MLLAACVAFFTPLGTLACIKRPPPPSGRRVMGGWRDGAFASARVEGARQKEILRLSLIPPTGANRRGFQRILFDSPRPSFFLSLNSSSIRAVNGFAF